MAALLILSRMAQGFSALPPTVRLARLRQADVPEDANKYQISDTQGVSQTYPDDAGGGSAREEEPRKK
jgi:hypothetical protein